MLQIAQDIRPQRSLLAPSAGKPDGTLEAATIDLAFKYFTCVLCHRNEGLECCEWVDGDAGEEGENWVFSTLLDDYACGFRELWHLIPGYSGTHSEGTPV